MTLDEIFQAVANQIDSVDNRTAYQISDSIRRELDHTVPSVDWSEYGSGAYELTRLVGRNMKWKRTYPTTSNINILLNAVST